MNLSSMLEKSWTKIFNSHSEGHLVNESLMAFQFCESIRAEHSELNICFDGRDLPTETERPNIVIQSKDDKPTILFFGKLIFKPQYSLVPGQEIKKLLQVINQKHMDVLARDKNTGCYDKIRTPLSHEYKFGIFVFHRDGQVGFSYKSLADFFTVDQLSRLHYGHNGAVKTGHTSRESSFRQPPEISRVVRGQMYPDLRFKLDNGRKVFVDSLVLEPTYNETIDISEGSKSSRIVLDRKRLKTEELFGSRNKITLLPKLLDTNPPTIENTCMTVWLSSEPLSKEALFSELIVLFFFQYEKGMTLEDILLKELHDLDWEQHATDTNEKKVALWKESWLNKTIH